MSNRIFNPELSRRDMLRLSAAGATALGTSLAFPALAAAATGDTTPAHHAADLYTTLLQTWCDGLIAHQVINVANPALHGALLCPACGLIHGRCGDAVYPLLRVAHTTGDEKYLRAALLVNAWMDRNMGHADGSWVSDFVLSPWKGTTVFHSIALAESLEHHGTLLPAATRRQMTDRLALAAKFLDGFITIETGNINYPITASLAFTLCGQHLNNAHYLDRAHSLAHTALDYFTTNGFIFGEGHPLHGVTAKGCQPVDLGYNVEESLPALALYGLLNNDSVVLDKAIASMRSHMEFMLPDGGWDNSWGTRSYKWTYWGSRTSDGCHPAFVLLSPHEPVFREIAQRNLEMMAACTHNGLLYGGPDYFEHGDNACIHHTFTHAKALALVLDRGKGLQTGPRLPVPRDAAYGLKSYPEIGAHLTAIGDWRATVTEYDWNYVEDVQTTGTSAGGGHATGGAITTLHHQQLGPILTASMTEYALVEISNQQAFTDAPHMPLTTRIEFTSGDKTYTSLSDFAASVSVEHVDDGKIVIDASGKLLTAAHQSVPQGWIGYRLTYVFTAEAIEITASADVSQNMPGPYAPLRFILPVIARKAEQVELVDNKTVHIRKPKGMLAVHTDASQGFDAIPGERTFNLVPGFECVPLIVTMQPGTAIRIRLEASLPA